MIRYYLTQLRIEGFRGINNEGDPLSLTFNPNAVNSIFAANGQGKSSIYEALSYAIRGTIPKLERLQASDHAEEYYCNRFHSTRTAVINLTFTPDTGGAEVITIAITRSPDGQRCVTSPTGHPDPEAFLSELNEDYALLDYGTFIKFIDDSPLERGRSFSALLGMGRLSQLRQALDVLANAGNIRRDFELDALEASYHTTSQQATTALGALRASHEKLLGERLTEPVNKDSVIATATAALNQTPLLKPSLEEKDISTVDFEELKAAIRTAEKGEQQEQLTLTIQSISQLEALAPPDSERRERTDIEETLRKRDDALAATRGPLLKKLYDTVSEVLESEVWEDPSLCPACESTPTPAPRDFVASRLQQYETAAEHETALRNGWIGAAFPERLRRLENEMSLNVKPSERRFSFLDGRFHRESPTSGDLTTAFETLDRLETKRTAAIKELSDQKQTLEKDLPASLVALSEQVEYAKQLKDSLARYVQHSAEAQATKARIDQRKRWQQFIEDASNTFATAETEYSRARTAALQHAYQKMYGRILNTDEVRPKLAKPTASENLQLQLEKFYDLEDAPAGPLLCESARNAAAISVFLSAALTTSGAPRFMVLDDVTSSFDAGHQFNLMELLRTTVGRPENQDGFQLILLSHDGLLEKYFDKLSNTKAWHHQRLQGWPPTGCVMSETQDANRLRTNAERFVRAGQVKQAEPLIRQYLEFKLLQVINKVRIPVPLDFAIRDHLHMVSNSLEAIEASIELHQKAGILVLGPAQQSALRGRHAPALVGNWVSHYETASGASLAPSALLGILQSIDALGDCFCYDCTCSGTTQRRYYRDLSSKQCSC